MAEDFLSQRHVALIKISLMGQQTIEPTSQPAVKGPSTSPVVPAYMFVQPDYYLSYRCISLLRFSFKFSCLNLYRLYAFRGMQFGYFSSVQYGHVCVWTLSSGNMLRHFTLRFDKSSIMISTPLIACGISNLSSKSFCE
jgi:hypothetical protein